jgi:hypothetical protein
MSLSNARCKNLQPTIVTMTTIIIISQNARPECCWKRERNTCIVSKDENEEGKARKNKMADAGLLS